MVKHTVHVVNPSFEHPSVVLSIGDGFEFGRDVGGAGRISERQAVSRLHGRLDVTDDGFAVTTVGSQIGVTVADRTTPSRLVVPRRTGPVPVPFRRCSIIVELRDGRDYLDVTVSGSDLADRWDDGWGPEMRDRWFDDRVALPATAGFIGNGKVRWRKTNGAPYAWYTTLVALCAPALGDAPAGTPTNEQLRARLLQSKSVTERHLTQIYEAFGLEDAARDREVVVALAVDSGIVTRQDVEALP